MLLNVMKRHWLQKLMVTHGQPKVCQLLAQFIILALQCLLLSLALLLLCYLLCTPLLPQHLLDHTRSLHLLTAHGKGGFGVVAGQHRSHWSFQKPHSAAVGQAESSSWHVIHMHSSCT